MNRISRFTSGCLAAGLAALLAGACASVQPAGGGAQVIEPKAPGSQAPAPTAGSATPNPPNADTGPLAPLAWLEGCWQGSVNQRDFREHWLPLRGGLLIGAGQSVLRGRVDDYQFLRLESKADGIYFTQFSGERKESSFRLATTTTDDKDTIFTFANTVDAFPARLVYRRGVEGWLYETIEGLLNGADKKVIYPLRRVDCESGEFIRR